MSFQTLNKIMVDYITVTSFREDIYKTGRRIQKNASGREREAKVMQYGGYLVDLLSGAIFAGSGIQKGMTHNMIRISGQASNDLLPDIAEIFQPYQDNVTRIDFQVTILEPADWSQWDTFVRMRGAGHHVGWVASRDKETGYELATIYIGNRASSPRFVRLYQKLTDDGQKLLRLEVEIKRKRAREHAKYLHEYARGDMSKARDELKHMSQKDWRLEIAFAQVLEGWEKPITVGRWDTDTAAWIKTQCLPAIHRYVNDHSSNQTAEIISVMKAIIESTER